jgi:hypothetical protein
MEDLNESMKRLALIIQNMHNLMIYTDQRKYEACTHELFRRYFTICSLLGDANRSKEAWASLVRTKNMHILGDLDMNLTHIETLLACRKGDRNELSLEYLDEAIRYGVDQCCVLLF